MKKLTTIILGLGLMAGSTLMANDTISAFYPAENDDTPDYILSSTQDDHSRVNNTLAKSTINKSALIAFFPVEDNDSPDYILNNGEDNYSKGTTTLAKSTINENTLCALYPEEHTDSPRGC